MNDARPRIRPVPARAGDLVHALAAGPFHFSESRHLAPLPLHAHERPTITILLEGEYRETVGRRVIDATVASVLFRPGGAAHADRFGHEGAVNFVIEIDPRRATALHGYGALLEDVSCVRGPGLGALGRRMRGELRTPDGVAPLALEGLALELLAAATRHARRAERALTPWLARVRELIDARFADASLRMSDLAREADVHPVHLARAFREQYGLSPAEYVRQLRLEWAARAIREGKEPLATIAAEAGFVDQSHMTRVFRRRLLMTPAQLRRRYSP
jgi:AraC family transcriptional regulator